MSVIITNVSSGNESSRLLKRRKAMLMLLLSILKEFELSLNSGVDLEPDQTKIIQQELEKLSCLIAGTK